MHVNVCVCFYWPFQQYLMEIVILRLHVYRCEIAQANFQIKQGFYYALKRTMGLHVFGMWIFNQRYGDLQPL